MARGIFKCGELQMMSKTQLNQKILALQANRKIVAPCLKTMRSPVKHLMQTALPDSIFNIAPERIADEKEEFKKFTLFYTDHPEWSLWCDTNKRNLNISRGAVELIWCASLAHIIFYTECIMGKNFDHPTFIDFQSRPRTRDSLKLLGWAIDRECKKTGSDTWPQGLPCPSACPVDQSDEHIANEMCLASCAFLFHHELAHIRLKHGRTKDAAMNIEQENDADTAAINHILSGIEQTDSRFIKRMLGIVQAYLLTNAVGLYGGNLGGGSHPFSYNRLSAFLDRIHVDGGHIGYAIAFAVLLLHFQNSGRNWEMGEYADSKEALEALCDRIAAERNDPLINRRILQSSMVSDQKFGEEIR